MSKAAELAALIGSQTSLSNRNLIINGAMQVAQRGTSAITLSNSSQYPVDRFHSSRDTTGVTATIQQDSTVPNSTFNNSLKVSVTTGSSVGASEDGFVRYKVEGYDASRLGFGNSDAKTMTFSFWVRSSETGTFGVSFGNSAADRGYNATYAISTANTWEHKTITIAGDTSGTWLTTNGNGMFINFDIGCGSSRSRAASSSWETSYLPGLTSGVKILETTGATWYITGVQLEVGEQATPFEHRSFGDELARCMRYYNTSGIVVASGTPDRYHNQINLPVEMRSSPTITTAAIDNGSGATMVSTWDRENSANSSKAFYQGANNTVLSSARFTFDAEL